MLNTHVHADHVSGATLLRGKCPALRSAIASCSGAAAHVCIAAGDRVPFGGRYVSALATPGHTSGCMSFVTDDGLAVFTGDALLIRGCGRTDFQQVGWEIGGGAACLQPE